MEHIGKAPKAFVLIIAIAAAVVSIAVTGDSAAAESKRSATPGLQSKPVHAVVLDGIDATATADVFTDSVLGQIRTENYLAFALKNAWGEDYAITAATVAWGGRLRDDDHLDANRFLARGQICRMVEKGGERPKVIIGHSWGSVVAYEALTALQSEPCPSGKRLPDNSIVGLITLGGPLASARMAERVKTLPETILGQEILGTPLKKPLLVTRWVNFWSKEDPLSAPITAANQNISLTYPGLGPFAAHSAYHANPEIASGIAKEIVLAATSPAPAATATMQPGQTEQPTGSNTDAAGQAGSQASPPIHD